MEISKVQKYNLTLVRIIALTMIGSFGAIAPFINVYMVRQGLSGTKVGIVITAASVLGLYFAPFWTRAHTTHRRPLTILSLTLIGAGISAVLLGYQVTFIGIIVMNSLRALFNSAHFSIVDMLALSAMKGTDAGYGSIRFLGSLGWAVIVLFTGWLAQRTNIRVGFFVYLAFNLISVFLISLLREKERFSHARDSQTKINYLSETVRLFSDPVIRTLSFTLLIVGIGNGGILNFETIYLDRLGASGFILGIYSMASAGVEVIAMPLTDRILRKHNFQNIMMIAMLLNCLQRLFIILFPAIGSILGMRLFTGITYSMVTVGQVQWINRVLPESRVGAALVILTVTLPTLISMFISPIYGMIYDDLGPLWLYALAGVFYLFAAVVLKFGPRGSPDQTV